MNSLFFVSLSSPIHRSIEALLFYFYYQRSNCEVIINGLLLPAKEQIYPQSHSTSFGNWA